MDSDSDEPLTPFEQQRAARVARIKAYLATLGLTQKKDARELEQEEVGPRL